MSVFRDGQSWYVYIGFGSERLRKRSPDNSKAGALAYEALIRREAARHGSLRAALGALRPKTVAVGPTFGPFAEQWLATEGHDFKPSSLRSISGILRREVLPFFGKMVLREIKRSDIARFKTHLAEERDLGPKTINNMLSVVRSCLVAALDDELIEKLPHIKWAPLDDAHPDFLTFEESERLLWAAEPNYWRELYLCGMRTGMRRGELFALRWPSVDLERHTIAVCESNVEGVVGSPKSRRVRVIPIPDDLYAVLSARTSRDGYVFPGLSGGPIGNTSWPWKALQRACKRAGLRAIGLHVLRHTYASHLVMAGVPLYTVQKLMGHASMKTTERYAHLAPNYLQHAVAALPELAVVRHVFGSRLPDASPMPSEIISPHIEVGVRLPDSAQQTQKAAA